jgi:hypothetical protein
MRTIMLRNSSGISAAAILDTTRRQFSASRPPVNWVVGPVDQFGDPDERAHPVVNSAPQRIVEPHPGDYPMVPKFPKTYAF